MEWINGYVYLRNSDADGKAFYEYKLIKLTKAKYNGEFIDSRFTMYVGENSCIYHQLVRTKNIDGIEAYEFVEVNNSDVRGYPSIRTTINGVKKNFKVHRIVASTLLELSIIDKAPLGIDQSDWNIIKTMKNFMGTMYDMLQVNHIDHDTYNFEIDNLEWCTGKANIDAYHGYAGF